MNKKEIAEIKKLLTPQKTAITRMAGCYVDGEKQIKARIGETFLSLPEEEMFKYFEIFRKALSGVYGKNLINMTFEKESEDYGGAQEFLMRLRETELKDPNILEEFYQKIIDSYDYGENYLILLVFANYDVPGRTTDDIEMYDASEEVYSHILCTISPVKLSKAGLAWEHESQTFHDRIRDWVVELPETGFLFPSFNNRSTDIHNLLFYAKNPEDLHWDYIDAVLGANIPLTAKNQKETFTTVIEETLGSDCDFDTVKDIHDHLQELIEENKEEPKPLSFDKTQLKELLADSGVSLEKLETFEETYEENTSTQAPLIASNITTGRKFEVKMPDVVINVNPTRTDLVETRIIDGRQCIVITINDDVQVNGIPIKLKKDFNTELNHLDDDPTGDEVPFLED